MDNNLPPNMGPKGMTVGPAGRGRPITGSGPPSPMPVQLAAQPFPPAFIMPNTGQPPPMVVMPAVVQPIPVIVRESKLSVNAPVFESRLSANAAVFVPRAYQVAQPEPVLQPPQGQPAPVSGWRVPPSDYDMYQEPSAVDGSCDFLTQTQDPVQQMKQAIIILTTNPETFDNIMKPLTDRLSTSIQDEQTFLKIVEEIFSQAIIESNFRYTGARICNYFSHNLAKTQTGTFRQLLIKRCQLDYTNREHLIQTNETAVIGFTLFLGELLLNMTIADGRRIDKFASAILDILSTLLIHPSDPTLKCVVQVLKLTGAILDAIERSSTENHQAPKLDQLFDQIKRTTVDFKGRTRNIKSMLLSVIELRANDWGRKDASPQLEVPPPGAPPVPAQVVQAQILPSHIDMSQPPPNYRPPGPQWQGYNNNTPDVSNIPGPGGWGGQGGQAPGGWGDPAAAPVPMSVPPPSNAGGGGNVQGTEHWQQGPGNPNVWSNSNSSSQGGSTWQQPNNHHHQMPPPASNPMGNNLAQPRAQSGDNNKWQFHDEPDFQHWKNEQGQQGGGGSDSSWPQVGQQGPGSNAWPQGQGESPAAWSAANDDDRLTTEDYQNQEDYLNAVYGSDELDAYDELDDEMEAAFEEFILENEQKQQNFPKK